MLKSIRVDEETHKRLRISSAETGSPILEIVKQAVLEFIPTTPIKKLENIPVAFPKPKSKPELTRLRGELSAEDYV